MYKLMVVDDEKIVVDAVNFIVKNHISNVKVCAAARSGEDAVEMVIRIKPDIVLMDICMSGMNGLEAIEAIKQIAPQTRFVIISAYEQFEFAKQAVELSVMEYLLKPVNAQRLKETISKITTELDKEQLKVRKNMETKGKFDQAVKILEHWLIYSLLLNKDPYPELKKYCELVGISENSGYVMILSYVNDDHLSKKSGRQTIREKEQFYIVLSDILRVKGYCLMGPAMQDKIIMYIFAKQNDSNESKHRSVCFAEEIMREIRKVSDLIFTFGLGSIRDNTQIMLSYEEARKALRMSSGGINHFFDLSPDDEGEPAASGYVKQSIKMSECDDVGKTRDRISRIIHDAKQYIEERYSSDISLESLAQELGISPQYLCKLFKKETKVNFIDYVTQKRLEKAMEMMKEGGKSIKEICFMVGYTDPNYFSRIFRKHTDHSPSEYIKGV